MNNVFEELDYRRTPLGELVLRRRTEPALARYALEGLGAGPLDVVVGGLGLGYTARAVLDHPAVRSLVVVEALPDVVEWHCRGLVALGSGLVSDPRCELLDGDFFSIVKRPGLHPQKPAMRFHAIVVDIDHSPRHVLHASHAELYEARGLRQLASHLVPRGVFALWSNDPPDADFCAALGRVFAHSEARVVKFHNPLTGGDSANTVYLAQAAGA